VKRCPMLPHEQLLVRSYMHFAARSGSTEQHKSRLLIFREEGVRAGLIHRSAQEPARARQTPALMTDGGKQDAVPGGRIPDELAGMTQEFPLPLRSFQSDQKARLHAAAPLYASIEP
jgi:hypothetical protein